MNKYARRFSYIIIALVLICAVQFFARPQASFSQIKTFSHMVPFTTRTGLMGFFNQNSGKIYLYDEDFNKCLFIYQLKEYGEDLVKLK